MMYALTILAIAATAGNSQTNASPLEDVNVAPAIAAEKSAAAPGIPQEQIDEATKVGELSGVAEACGMEWQPHLNAYMKAKRIEGVPEMDMTFLAAYHGAAQGNAYNMVEKTCSDEQKKQIQDAMNENIAKFEKAEKQ